MQKNNLGRFVGTRIACTPAFSVRFATPYLRKFPAYYLTVTKLSFFFTKQVQKQVSTRLRLAQNSRQDDLLKKTRK